MRLKSWTFTRLKWQLWWWVSLVMTHPSLKPYLKLKEFHISLFRHQGTSTWCFVFDFRRRKVIFKICWKQKLLHWPKLIVLFRSTGVEGPNRKPRYNDVFFFRKQSAAFSRSCFTCFKFSNSSERIYVGYWSSLFGQDGWILAKFFFAFLWTKTALVHKLAKKKERGQYPAILTEQACSIKDLKYGFRGNLERAR